MISILIPIRNEYENLDDIERIFKKNFYEIRHEVILINDFSNDNTLIKAEEISKKNKNFIVYNNQKKGLGGAINLGIEKANGKFICIMMADLSDDINDLKKYYTLMEENNYDAVFGSRFITDSKVIGYPKQKLILNRVFNFIVKLVFLNRYNDYTNAFKIYKSEMIKNFLPLMSESFNVFLELPLKVISRKYDYKVIPINWSTRKRGEAKFKIKELRSKYLFTLIYCFIEKILLKKEK
jgi:dolichol-phosphate mannosyltransferase|tara:strand:- start:2095 stop:2808 length:714 start_codon:yes stop_codon:yes gene_type:complete